jgi:LAO/AO transport system kinase
MVADTVVLCVQPGSGDSLQYIKAGIAEIPDVAVIGKADLGSIAIKAQGDLEAALALARRAGWSVPVIPVSGNKAQGIAALMRAIADHAAYLASEGRLAAKRQTQAQNWLADAVRDELGRRGLEQARRAGGLDLAPDQAPFGVLHRLIADLPEPPQPSWL